MSTVTLVLVLERRLWWVGASNRSQTRSSSGFGVCETGFTGFKCLLRIDRNGDRADQRKLDAGTGRKMRNERRYPSIRRTTVYKARVLLAGKGERERGGGLGREMKGARLEESSDTGRASAYQ